MSHQPDMRDLVVMKCFAVVIKSIIVDFVNVPRHESLQGAARDYKLLRRD
jgi:hypothetical protein